MRLHSAAAFVVTTLFHGRISPRGIHAFVVAPQQLSSSHQATTTTSSSSTSRSFGIAKPRLSIPMTSQSKSRLCMVLDFLNEGKKALVKSLAGDYDEAKIKARLDSFIADNPVVMLSFTTCPYCIKAKACLDNKRAKYTTLELDQDPDGKAIRAVLGDVVGRTSVPAIWIDGQFVGGCNDGPTGGLLQLDQQGKLDGMLRAVNALPS